jgi:enamine deaminase RidA (YjgF/YER057c/UK114 family)
VNQLEQKKADAIEETAPVSPRMALKKQKGPGLWITSVEGLAHEEFHLTLQPLPGEKPAEMVRRLATVLREKNATVVRHEIFGSNAAYKETMQILQRDIPDFDWPVMWIGGSKNTDNAISGMHMFAVAGVRVDTIRKKGEPIGRVFNDGCERHCFLGNVKPSNLTASKSAQCHEIFEKMERLLLEAGMDMANVVRTWFFLDDILSWYTSFNTVRNEFYGQKKVFNGRAPASTGIGGQNPFGAALVAGAWAIQTGEGSVVAHEVLSPLQCSSLEYGSAFSRAILLTGSCGRRLLVSGTASIGLDGRSLHNGDLHGQIGLSMKVVGEILASRGFNFSDVTRATAYFKNIQDTPAFDLWRERQGLELFPLITMQSTICRGELLFEIELDAISLGKTN